jgi:hypothetical protein
MAPAAVPRRVSAIASRSSEGGTITLGQPKPFDPVLDPFRKVDQVSLLGPENYVAVCM